MAVHFTTVPWLLGANIYEVNLRQYTQEGTFAAFTKHLPRLKDMGVKILWLMPITPISTAMRQGTMGSYYACSSYTTTNEEFGTVADFKQLVNECHASGFKVLIDWVANHTGYEHEWTINHNDWYVKDEAGNYVEKNGWIDVIDLDYANTDMRKAMIEAMHFWVKECDIDGFRCDMAHLVPLDFWYDTRKKCDDVKPLLWLGECEVMEYNNVFDITYAWQWMHATDKLFTQPDGLQLVQNVLHQYSQYPAGANKLFFTSNHDENSWNGTEYEKYGNAAKALAVFTCTWQGIPLLYSGQENPLLKRLQFFDKDVIEWNEQPLLHNFYKQLLQLNNTNAIALGETFILPVTHQNVMAYLRRFKDDVVLVILNFSNHSKLNLFVEHPWLTGNFTNLFSGLTYQFNTQENFELQAGEYLVYAKG